MGSEHAIPEDLNTRYRLAKAQLDLLPPPEEDLAEEWLALRLDCEETMQLIERIAALETQVEGFRELLKRLRGYSVIMDIEWSEDWDEVLKRIVQRVQANNHLGKLAAERYDRILELERIIAALEAQVAALSKPVSDEESDKMLVFVNGHTTMTKTHSVLERKRMTEAASWLVLSRMAAARLKEPKECGYCGGTGEICYSSTSYGPCPECIAARLKESK